MYKVSVLIALVISNHGSVTKLDSIMLINFSKCDGRNAVMSICTQSDIVCIICFVYAWKSISKSAKGENVLRIYNDQVHGN